MNLFLFINEKLLFKRIWWLYRPALVEYYEQLVLPIDHYIFGASQHTNVPETTHMACKSKIVFKICEGISCYSFYVKEFDVIVHKNIFLI